MNYTESKQFTELLDIPLSDIFWLFYQVTKNTGLTLRDVHSLGYESISDLLAENIHALYNNIIKEQDNDAYTDFIETLSNLGLQTIAIDLVDNICVLLENLVNSYKFMEGSPLTNLKETFVHVHQTDKLCPLLRISELTQ